MPMNTKEKINLVWLKRDLRLHDNEAISKAIKNGKSGRPPAAFLFDSAPYSGFPILVPV